MSKLEEAKEILSSLKVPAKQQNGMCCCVLLAIANLTEEEALKVFKVAAALQLTAKGQAVIYYGEEIGQHGLNNYPIQSNRYDFDWNQVDTQSADANSMLNHYEKLLSIRTEYKKLFARGDRSSVLASDDDGYEGAGSPLWC